MSEKPRIDPFFGLKYVAYCRTNLPPNDEDLDDSSLLSFAKWQICKMRNKLWNDPIWDSYTSQEIMIEYFSIKFDENEKLKKDFERGIVEVKKSDLDWFAQMEAQHAASQAEQSELSIIKGADSIEEKTPEEFEDTF